MNTKNTNKDYSLVKKVKEQSIAVIFFALVAVILITSIVIYNRIDLTKNKIYSISEVSKEIMKEIDNPVYVDYYLSSSLTITNEQPQQIIDLLDELSARSRGKVIFSVKDASEDEYKSEVEQYKIEAKQIQVVEKEQASFSIVYSGIVISYQDRVRVIPFVIEPSIIEYQVISKIQEVYTNDDRVVGILLLDSELDFQNDLGALDQVLSGDYKVERVESGKKIDDDIDALFVIGSDMIDNDTAYYVDQFVMSGKGVFFLVDRAQVSLHAGLNVTEQSNLLLDMIEAYGVEIEPKIVADEFHKLIPLNRGGGFQVIQPYSMWITINEENVNTNHPITSSFGGMDLYWTSPLVSSLGEEKFIPLVRSSDKAWTIPSSPASPSGVGNSEETVEEEAPRNIFNVTPDQTNFQTFRTNENTKQYVVVAAVLGEINSVVEKGLVIMPEAVSENEAEAYKSSVAQGRFLITGSSRIATGIYQATNAGYNILFMSTASDWLASSDKLLQIKSRNVRNTQLNKITSETKKAALILFVKIFNMVLLPLIIIIVGVVVLMYRRNLSKKRY